MKNSAIGNHAVIVAALTILVASGVIGVITTVDAVAQVRPAVTKNIDEPGRNPYQYYGSAIPGLSSACGLNFCDFVLPAVPAGKRLVITNLHGTISLQPSAKVDSLRLIVRESLTTKNTFEVPPNPAAYYSVALTFQLDRYPFNAQLKMYADAGQTPVVSFWTGPGNLHSEWPSEISVTGYLVDLGL